MSGVKENGFIKGSRAYMNLYDEIIKLTKRVEALENPRKRKAPKPKNDYDVRQFNCFWENYPKKVDKIEAEQLWASKVGTNQALIGEIAHHSQHAYINTERQFIPSPAKYLRRQKWNDEIIEVKPKMLKLPAEDVKLSFFAQCNGLTMPPPGMGMWEYKVKLLKEIEDKQLMEK